MPDRISVALFGRKDIIIPAIIFAQTKLSPGITELFWPYFFLVHVGMIIWLISAVASVVKKRLKIKWSLVKVISGAVGALAVIPILLEFIFRFDAGEGGMGLLASNLLALILTSVFYDEFFLGLFVSYLDIFNIYYGYNNGVVAGYVIFFYLLLGFVGGWGIGQLIEWIMAKLNRKLSP